MSEKLFVMLFLKSTLYKQDYTMYYPPSQNANEALEKSFRKFSVKLMTLIKAARDAQHEKYYCEISY